MRSSPKWVTLFALLVPLLQAAAAGPAAPETDAEKVRKALDRVTNVEIVDQPMELAVQQLRDQMKINFILDRNFFAMQQQLFDPSQQQVVNLRLKNVRLRNALQSILAPQGLAYVILGDNVLITNEEMAAFLQLRQPVTFDLDGVPLREALRRLARETAANIALDPRVAKQAETRVTIQLDEVPLESAVRLLAETAGLKPVRMGNVIYVTTKANAAELRNDPELNQVEPQQQNERMMMMRMIGPGGMIMMGNGQVPITPPPPEKGDLPGEKL